MTKKQRTKVEEYSKRTIGKDEWKRCSEDYVIDVDKRGKFEQEATNKPKKFKVQNPRFTE
jgi:hypothetical protein